MAVTGDGRVFVSAPQAMQPASMPTLGELIDGSLRPFRPGSAESFARPSVSSGGGHRPPPTNQHARSKHEPDIR